MKQGIHPQYTAAKAVCACGNQFETRATVPMLKVDICSACHPFFTGTQKLVDTAGRVERFSKRFESTGGRTVSRTKQVQKKIAKAPPKPKGRVLTSTPVAASKKKKPS